MWLCFNDGFFSVIESGDDSGALLVRARREGDLQRYFPGAAVKRTPGRDYLFRAVIAREDVARVVSEELLGLSYRNFKGSVRDRSLHDAYAGVWQTMARLQSVAPYSLVEGPPGEDPPAS